MNVLENEENMFLHRNIHNLFTLSHSSEGEDRGNIATKNTSVNRREGE